MKSITVPIWLPALGVMLLQTACTSDQTYGVVQSWQRSECNKMIGQDERERCLRSNSTSYDDYRRETAQDKNP